MGPEQKKLVIASWLFAVLFVITWSSVDAIKVLWAASRHEELPKTSLNLTDAALTEFKRSEQKYFLDYGVYVPLEDIMYVDQLPAQGARYADALREGCSGLKVGDGLAIWLPLKIKWPFIGERVKEWCWKPPVQH